MTKSNTLPQCHKPCSKPHYFFIESQIGVLFTVSHNLERVRKDSIIATSDNTNGNKIITKTTIKLRTVKNGNYDNDDDDDRYSHLVITMLATNDIDLSFAQHNFNVSL